jgi:hypothetical protein
MAADQRPPRSDSSAERSPGAAEAYLDYNPKVASIRTAATDEERVTKRAVPCLPK